ncbi:hypothetical protein RQP54_15510 [Curvibacter sp. APW13]|uniref:hypothetical protein n=1 Tax=Curvibacter sp. APW13 TaxID=3077236 RepID=UPI0028E06527|nr:hypothetical protein [Curvibacter sp. APW13]MDT8992279.1 hypothetical protein [Curvibacter sp. APW13]
MASRWAWVRWLRGVTVAFGFAAMGLQAWACAICAPSAAEQTLTQRLFKSQAVAIARATGQPGVFSVTAPVHGVDAGATLRDVAAAQDGSVPASGASVLLAQSGGSWRVMAQMPVQRATWVARLIALRRAPDANPADADWEARFTFFAPDLENPVQAVAQVAYEELSNAPLGAMRSAARHFAGLPLQRWLTQPALVDRTPLYALMFGFVAPAQAAVQIQRDLLARSSRAPLAANAAWMAAVLELQGEAGLAWLVRNYLQAPARADDEVQAALLAMRVHVADGKRLNRSAASQAIRSFVGANPQRAGFAASDLGDWGQWDFVADFERLLDTDQPQVFASRYGMVLYMLRNPQPQAKEALERLRAKGRL